MILLTFTNYYYYYYYYLLDDEFNLTKEIHRLDPSGFQQALKSTNLIKSIESEFRITPLFGGRASQLVIKLM